MAAPSPPAPTAPDAPHLTPQLAQWTQALGYGPLYVRRALLVQQAPQAAPTTAPMATPATTPVAPAPVVAATPPRVIPPSPSTRSSPTPRSAPRPAVASEGDAARAEAIARMDWPALDAATQVCRACKLGSSRHQAVFGSGATTARWMIVGEAPGAEEDRQGLPFVGAAGQLLDAMLHAIGLDRHAQEPQHAVYIANVLKCRPPGNRNPEPVEVAQCAPLLQRQIALLQPRLILALGRFAAQSLLGSTAPISQLRDQVHHVDGIPVVVSYHPAYLLRNPADKARVWRDLCFARQVMTSAAPAQADAQP